MKPHHTAIAWAFSIVLAATVVGLTWPTVRIYSATATAMAVETTVATGRATIKLFGELLHDPGALAVGAFILAAILHIVAEILELIHRRLAASRIARIRSQLSFALIAAYGGAAFAGSLEMVGRLTELTV